MRWRIGLVVLAATMVGVSAVIITGGDNPEEDKPHLQRMTLPFDGELTLHQACALPPNAPSGTFLAYVEAVEVHLERGTLGFGSTVLVVRPKDQTLAGLNLDDEGGGVTKLPVLNPDVGQAFPGACVALDVQRGVWACGLQCTADGAHSEYFTFIR